MRRLALRGVSGLMGRIWGAANREEGYKLGAEAGWFVILVDVIVWTWRVLFRFFSGRPMFGDRHRKTNAGWSTPGTNLYNPNSPMTRPPFRWGKSYCWSALPEWKRGAIRTGVLLALLATWWIYDFIQSHPFMAGGAAFVVVLPATRKVARKWRARRFNRVYLHPLANAAGPVLNIPPNTPAHTWVHVSPDLPGLLPNLVKPMSPLEKRIREWYGQHLEPVVRYVPDRVMRAYWWATGHVSGVTKGWGSGNERV